MINIMPRKIENHSFLFFFSLKNIIPPKVATITQLWEIEKLIVTPNVLVVINIPKFAIDHSTPVIKLNKTFSLYTISLEKYFTIINEVINIPTD